MKFEKFYLIDSRDSSNKIMLKFVHVENGRSISATTAAIIKILQYGEIKIQTKFATSKFTNKYAKHKYRNLRSIKDGDPINVYHIPVSLAEDKKNYIMEFYNRKEM